MNWLQINALILIFFVTLPLYVQAEGFVSLVGVPGLNPNELSTSGYINALYVLSISIAAFLAVVRIIFAGVQYMLSDIAPTKSQAKDDIKGAILGLIIVLGAVLLLETINPQLKNFAILDTLQPLEATTVQKTVITPFECPSKPNPAGPEDFSHCKAQCDAKGGTLKITGNNSVCS